MRRLRTLLTTSVAVVLAMAGAATAAASGPVRSTATVGVSSAAFGCTPGFSQIASLDAVLTHQGKTLNYDNLLGVPPEEGTIGPRQGVTALGSTVRTLLPSPMTSSVRNFVVAGGSLQMDLTTFVEQYPPIKNVKHTTRTVWNGGWGAVTRLVDASDNGDDTKNGYLYALIPFTGQLARYRVTESTLGAPTVRWAGVATGYSTYRGLALASRSDVGMSTQADVLLATTTKGQLVKITIPATTAFTPQARVVRAATWTFDQLVLDRCSNGRAAMIAVNSQTDRASLYRVDSLAGATSIRGFGTIGVAWSAPLSAGFWDYGRYPDGNPTR